MLVKSIRKRAKRLILRALGEDPRRRWHPRWPAPEIQNFIVSFPKCGRTWLRALMAAALASDAGDPIEPLIDRWMAVNGPAIAGQAILFTHGLADHDDEPVNAQRCFCGYLRAKRCLLLFRDPRDVVVSYHLHRQHRSASHHNHAPDGLSEFIRHPRLGIPAIVGWQNLWYTERQMQSGPTLMLSYERLGQQTEGSLAASLEFFGLACSPEPISNAAAFCQFDHMQTLEAGHAFGNDRLRAPRDGNPDGYKVRRGVVGGFRDYLSADDQAWADHYIQMHLAIDIGYHQPGQPSNTIDSWQG